MVYRIALPIALAMAVCGCTSTAAQVAPSTASNADVAQQPSVANLDGTHWRFVKLGGVPVPPQVGATLRFHNGHIAGRAGCNSYGGKYQVAGDGSAHFQRGVSTMMACLQPPDAMRVERGVFDVLRQTARVKLADGELVMLDAAGQALAQLAPDAGA